MKWDYQVWGTNVLQISFFFFFSREKFPKSSFGNLVILYVDSRDLNFSLIMKIIHIHCGTFRKYKKKIKKNALKKNKEENNLHYNLTTQK